MIPYEELCEALERWRARGGAQMVQAAVAHRPSSHRPFVPPAETDETAFPELNTSVGPNPLEAPIEAPPPLEPPPEPAAYEFEPPGREPEAATTARAADPTSEVDLARMLLDEDDI